MTGHAARRMEAAPGTGLRRAASAAHPLSRRAHFRRRSHLAPPVLGPDSPDVGRGRDRVRHHALHGRSRILQPAGADFSRQDGRSRHADRIEAEIHEGRVAADRVRTAGHRGRGLAGVRPDVMDAAVFGNALHVLVPERARQRISTPAEIIWRSTKRTSQQDRKDPPQPGRRLRLADQRAEARKEPHSMRWVRLKAVARKRSHPDPARFSQPGHRGDHAGSPGAVLRLRGESRSQAPAHLRVRPRRQPAEPGVAEAFPGQRIFRDRARSANSYSECGSGPRRWPGQDGARHSLRLFRKAAGRRNGERTGARRRDRRQHRQRHHRLRPGGRAGLFQRRATRVAAAPRASKYSRRRSASRPAPGTTRISKAARSSCPACWPSSCR